MSISPINVPQTASSVAPIGPFDYGEDYAFYDARTNLVPNYYQKLLESATKSIENWDTYTRVDDWKVFKDELNGVKMVMNLPFFYHITEKEINKVVKVVNSIRV